MAFNTAQVVAYFHSSRIQHFPVLRLLCRSREGTWRSVSKHYSLRSCTADRLTGIYFLKHKQRIGIGKWPVFFIISIIIPNSHRILHRSSLRFLAVPQNEKGIFYRSSWTRTCQTSSNDYVTYWKTKTGAPLKISMLKPQHFFHNKFQSSERFNFEMKVSKQCKRMAVTNRKKEQIANYAELFGRTRPMECLVFEQQLIAVWASAENKRKVWSSNVRLMNQFC